MRYARIENGIVKEIIDFNPKGKFTKEIEQQFVQCTETVEQNFIYKNGKFEKKKEKELNKEEKNNIIVQQIKETDSDLLQLIEDIAEWVESKGFIIPTHQKALIEQRKLKRDQIT